MGKEEVTRLISDNPKDWGLKLRQRLGESDEAPFDLRQHLAGRIMVGAVSPHLLPTVQGD